MIKVFARRSVRHRKNPRAPQPIASSVRTISIPACTHFAGQNRALKFRLRRFPARPAGSSKPLPPPCASFPIEKRPARIGRPGKCPANTGSSALKLNSKHRRAVRRSACGPGIRAAAIEFSHCHGLPPLGFVEHFRRLRAGFCFHHPQIQCVSTALNHKMRSGSTFSPDNSFRSRRQKYIPCRRRRNVGSMSARNSRLDAHHEHFRRPGFTSTSASTPPKFSVTIKPFAAGFAQWRDSR